VPYGRLGAAFSLHAKENSSQFGGGNLFTPPIKAGTCGIRYVGEGADPTPPWMRVQVRRGDVLGTADRYIISVILHLSSHLGRSDLTQAVG
jgi:hypothetical protein